jgi:DNA (cytosine-5)-methyltransferase 1
MTSSIRYLSICSGIEAASVAWHPLGWTPVAFSEIEPFPSAVLAHRFPDVPNLGDMTAHAAWPLRSGDIDLLVGGTPCQSFSVAGLRRGLSDPRGGLMLTYLEIARSLRPRWIVWENVPGVLSSGQGRDFGSFLGALGELGYGWAYRVLDAQWVRTHGHPRAVPQRRRRVFVVGCLGDWAAAAEVLFERESVRRDPAPRAASRQGSADDAAPGARASRWPASVASTLNHSFGEKLGLEDQHALNGAPLFVPDIVIAQDVAATLNQSSKKSGGIGFSNQELFSQSGANLVAIQGNLIGRDAGGPHGVGVSTEGASYTLTKADVHGVAFRKSKRAQSATDDESWIPEEQANTLNEFDTGERDTHAVTCVNMGGSKGRADNCKDGSSYTLSTNEPHAVAFHPTQDPISSADGSTHCMGTGSGQGNATVAIAHAMTVRRLTPRECERLQGFPDDWTLIPWRKRDASDCPDAPRYKALGNSMAVNCMEWIGERIAAREAR